MIAIPPSHAPAGLRTATRRAATTLAALALLLAGPASAHAAQGGVSIATSKTTAKGAQAEVATETDAAAVAKPRSVSKPQIRRAQTLLRTGVTGTNDTKTRKVVKRFQQLRGLTTHGIIDVPTYLQIKDAFALLETGGATIDTDATTPGTGGITTTAPATPELTLPTNLAPITPQERQILDTIAQCESNGDITIVSSNGLYRGKYQFDRATWKSVGGTGDPAVATELEQDQRAAILLRQRGTAPWPICGRDAA